MVVVANRLRLVVLLLAVLTIFIALLPFTNSPLDHSGITGIMAAVLSNLSDLADTSSDAVNLTLALNSSQTSEMNASTGTTENITVLFSNETAPFSNESAGNLSNETSFLSNESIASLSNESAISNTSANDASLQNSGLTDPPNPSEPTNTPLLSNLTGTIPFSNFSLSSNLTETVQESLNAPLQLNLTWNETVPARLNVSLISNLTGNETQASLDLLLSSNLTAKKEHAPTVRLKNKKSKQSFTPTGELELELEPDPEGMSIMSLNEAPRASVRISGLASNLSAKLDRPKKPQIRTDIFSVEENAIFDSALLSLPKYGEVNAILYCPSYDQTYSTCPSWQATGIPFTQNSTHITFTVTHFTAYAGGAPTYSSNLTIWDEADPEGGSKLVAPNGQLFFFANYTNSTSGASINGTGVYCNITFPDSTPTMVWNSSAFLYYYNRSFPSAGTYTWNSTCDGSAVGYNMLNASDTILITTCDPPASGNWNITQNRTCSNMAITLNGNLTINSGAALNLSNITLRMNSTETVLGAGYIIRVNSGAILFVDRTNITHGDNASVYWGMLTVYGKMIMNNSRVEYTSGGNAGGVYISDPTSQTKVYNSEFYDDAGNTQLIIASSTIDFFNLTSGALSSYALYGGSARVYNSFFLSTLGVGGGGKIYLINTSIGNTWHGTGGGEIWRQWYVYANVSDASGMPIASANISVYNASGQVETSNLTNSAGIAQLLVTEYAQINYSSAGSNFAKTFWTPNQINATKLAYSVNSTTVNLTQTNSTSVTITMIPSGSAQISSCQNLDTAGTTYTLTANVSSQGTCFNILADNITLDGQGFTVNYSQSITGYGVNITSRNNVTIKNLNIVHGNASISGAHAIEASGMTNSVIDNTSIITACTGGYGITFSSSSGNIILNNNLLINGGGTNYGLYLSTNSNNNFLANNNVLTVTANPIRIQSGNNSIINGSLVATGATIAEYQLYSAGSNNNFINTNFTGERIISFYDDTSWFNYNNGTDAIWLKTSNTVNALKSLKRTLKKWSQLEMTWNDTNSSGEMVANYNLTGLFSNTNYSVYNKTAGVQTNSYVLSTDANGNLPGFTINLTSATEITVNASMPYGLSSCQDLTFTGGSYVLTSNVSSAGTCFNILADNITLDGAGFTVNYSQVSTGYAINNSDGYDFITIKNLNIIQGNWSVSNSRAIYAYGMDNSTILNNTIILNASGSGDSDFGIYLRAANSNKVSNNSIATYSGSGYAIYFSTGGGSNEISDNIITTIGTNAYGLYLYFNNYNTVQNNIVTTSGTSAQALYLYLSNSNRLVDNRLSYLASAGGNPYTVVVTSAFNNNITGGSITSRLTDYSLQNASNTNNFANTNFTASRKIRFVDNSSWFNYNNETNGNIWLKTSVSNTATLNRTLLVWTQREMRWNDTNLTGGIIATYNLTGLTPNTSYSIYSTPGAIQPDSWTINGSTTPAWQNTTMVSVTNLYYSDGRVILTPSHLNDWGFENISNGANLSSSWILETPANSTINISSGLNSDRSAHLYFGSGTTKISQCIPVSNISSVWTVQHNSYITTGGGGYDRTVIEGYPTYDCSGGTLTMQQFFDEHDANSWQQNSVNGTITNNTHSLKLTINLLDGWGPGYNSHLYVDNIFLYSNISVTPYSSGNLTAGYNAGSGRELYKFEVKANTPTGTNYTVWYRRNGTSTFTQLGGTYTGNNTVLITGTRYQNTDVMVTLNGNTLNTPELTSITFYRSITPPYILGTDASGNLPSFTVGLDVTTEIKVIDDTPPGILFSSPTDADTSHIPRNWSLVNVSFVDTAPNGTAFINWNNSLVGWWRFNQESGENSTFFRDWSGYGNNGTCSGTTCPNSTSGKFGIGLQFDGINDLITAQNSAALNITGAFTMEGWFYFDNASGNKVLMGKGLGTCCDGNNGYVLTYSNSTPQYLIFDIHNTTKRDSLFTTVSITTGRWYHVAAGWDGTTNTNGKKVFLNGNIAGQGTSEISFLGATSYNFVIGRSSSGGAYFNGIADEVRVFARALPPEEINASFNAGSYRLYHNFSGLSDGAYSYTAYAQDFAGNVNQTETRTLMVDTVFPAVGFVSPTDSNGSYIPRNWSLVNVSFSDANLNGTAFINWNNSLVGWWRFNQEAGENATFFRDWSGYGNNGTCSGTTCPQGTTAGRFGAALQFDGSNDSVDVPNKDIGNVYSIGAWIKADPTNDGAAISFSSSADGYYAYSHRVNATSFKFMVSSSGSCSAPSWAHNVDVSLWHHYVLLRSNTTVTLYVDGINKGSGSTGADCTYNNTVSSFGIYRWFSGSVLTSYFNGTIDEVSIYNRMLSPEEINASFNAGSYRLYHNFSGLSDGAYLYTAYAQDLAGNVNQTEARTLVVDTVFPVVGFVSPTDPNGSYIPRNWSFVNVSFSDANLNGTAFINWNNSLVGWWRFNQEAGENATFFRDWSGYGNNGTCSGSQCPNHTIGGRFGGALDSFRGGQKVTIPVAASLNLINKSTIEIWTFSRPQYWGGLLSLYTAGGFSVSNSGLICFPIASNCRGSSTFDKWVHVVFTYDSSLSSNDTTTYVNGVAYTPYTVGTLTTNAVLAFGSGNYWLNNNSLIDEVRLWNRVLSPEEINASFNAGSYRLYHNFSGLSDGAYSYTAYAQDSAGNVNQTEARTLVVDTVLPAVGFVSPTDPNGSYIPRNWTLVNVSFSDANLNGTAFINWNNSLVGWWRFNQEAGENATFFRDWSGYGNNGTCSGTACPTYTRGGRFGSALLFDNETETVSYGKDLVSNNMTIEVWLKPDNLTSGVNRRILHDGRGAGWGPTPEITLWINSNNVQFSGGSNDSGGGFILDAPITTNWTHVVVVLEGTDMRIYANAVLGGTDTWAGVFNKSSYNFNNFQIAGRSDTPYYGLIDELRVWNRSLSSSEINASYNAGLNRMQNNFTGLANGVAYTYTAYVQDLSGNINQTESRILTVDLVPPYWWGNLTSPSSLATAYSQVQFNVSAADLISSVDTVLLEFNSSNYTTTRSGNVYTRSLSGFLPGVYTYRWYLNDSAGNLNVTDSFSYSMRNLTVDWLNLSDAHGQGDNILNLNEPYNITVRIRQYDGSYWTIPTGSFNLTAGGVTYPLTYTSNSVWRTSTSLNAPASVGNYSFFANVTGVSGNGINGTARNLNYTYAVKNISIGLNLDDFILNQDENVTVYGRAVRMPEGLSVVNISVNVSVDGVFNGTILTNSSGNYSYTFKVGETSSQRTYTVKVNLTDSNGIYGENTTTFTWYPTTSGTVRVPDQLIGNMGVGDYTFQINVTINNTGNGGMFNPAAFIDLGLTSSNIKSVVNISVCTPVKVDPGSSCVELFNVTVAAGSTCNSGDCPIAWVANWTTNNQSLVFAPTYTSYAVITGNPQMLLSSYSFYVDSNISRPNLRYVDVNNTGNVILGDGGGTVAVSFLNVSINGKTPMPSNWVSFYSTGTWTQPTNSWDYIGTGFSRQLRINLTPTEYYTGNYTGIVNVTATNDLGLQTYLEINLTASIAPNFRIESSRAVILNHGLSTTEYFLVNSTGNAKVVNATVVLLNETLPGGWVTLGNYNGSVIEGTYLNVSLEVSIPEYYAPGNYTARLNVTSNNVNGSYANLTVTVLRDDDWNFLPLENQTNSFWLNNPGIVGNITVFNTGNVEQNFTITIGGIDIDGAGPAESCLSWTCYGSYDKNDSTTGFVLVNPSSVFIPKNFSRTIFIWQKSSSQNHINTGIVVTISNLTATPTSQVAYLFTNVTNMKPALISLGTSAGGTPQNFTELDFGITLEAIASDDVLNGINVSKAYFNVTNPQGVVQQYTPSSAVLEPVSPEKDRRQFTYEYADTQSAGQYGSIFYVEDTSSNAVGSFPVHNFTVFENTTISLSPTPVSTSLVTYSSGYNISVPVIVTNTGNATAYQLNLSASIQTWRVQNVTIENISFGQPNSSSVLASIPANTPPGAYALYLNVSWRQPGGGSSFVSSSTTITVGSNQTYNVSGLADGYVFNNVQHGNSNVRTFNITALGNEPTVVTLSSSGTPRNITLRFSENNASYYTSISNLNVANGMSKMVYLDMLVAKGESPGTSSHLFGVDFANSQVSKSYSNLAANVLSDDSYNLTHSNISINGIANQNTLNQELRVTSNANVPISFGFNLTGNVTGFMLLQNTSVTLQPLEVFAVGLNYTAPNNNNIYGGFIFVNDTTSPTAYFNLSLTFHAYTLDLNITGFSAPAEAVAGDTIRLNMTLLLGTEYLTNQTSYAISLDGAGCPITSVLVDGNTTGLACTLPAHTDVVYHNLTVQANYSGISGGLSISKTQQNAVYYKDVTNPRVQNLSSEDVLPGQNLTLNVTVLDNKGLDSVLVEVTPPSGLNSTRYLMMNYSASGYYLILSNLTELGDYSVRYYANDSTGNMNSSETGTFEVYVPVFINSTIRDALGNPILMSMRFYKEGSSTLIEETASSVNGTYNLTRLHKRKYDLYLNTTSYAINLHGVNISGNSTNLLQFDPISSPPIFPYTRSVIKMFAFEPMFTFTRADITVKYPDNIPLYENSLRFYRCGDWGYTLRSCGGSWTRLGSGTIDKVNHVFSIVVMNFSSYALGEDMAAINEEMAVCGDKICATIFGESCVTCPGDCGYCSTSSSTTISSGSSFISSPQAQPQPQAKDPYLENLVRSLNASIADFLRNQSAQSQQPKPKLTAESNAISLDLYPGESTKSHISLHNGMNETKFLFFTVSDSIESFVSFLEPPTRLEAGEEESVGIQLSIPPETKPGVYWGEITIGSYDKSVADRIPVNIRVSELKEKLLDLKIQPLSESVEPGQILRVQADIYNLGQTKRVDVQLQLHVIDVQTEQVLAAIEEAIAIETTGSVIKQLRIPESTKLGRYLLKGTAYYSSGSRNSTLQATSFAYITISRPWWAASVMGVPIWSLVILFSILTVSGVSIRVYHVHQQKQQKYLRMLDFRDLPQPSQTAGFIGKVAETNIRTFIDMQKLQMHTVVAGATGGGKTIAAQVIVEEALKAGVGVIIFDPTAQWTGFLRKCTDKRMLGLYPKFQLSVKDARPFPGNIHIVGDARQIIDMKRYLRPGEINIFTLNKLDPKDIDLIVANTIRQVFKANLEESPTLKYLIVYEEVHRLLPKFGGSGDGFVQLERGVREFRKWGVGLLLISQVLSDFVGEIKANLGTEVQMRTRAESDLERIKLKYGEEFLKSIVKASEGAGMVENSSYNKGRPYFVEFRPILHSTTRLSDQELEKYDHYNRMLEDMSFQLEQLTGYKVDVFDTEVELKLAYENLRKGAFNMVDIYLESLEPKLKGYWAKLGKKPVKAETKLVDLNELKQEIDKAKKKRGALGSPLAAAGSNPKIEALKKEYEIIKARAEDKNKGMPDPLLASLPSDLQLAEATGSREDMAHITKKMDKLRKRYK